MPINQNTLEQAKKIAAQRLASRKTSVITTLREYDDYWVVYVGEKSIGNIDKVSEDRFDWYVDSSAKEGTSDSLEQARLEIEYAYSPDKESKTSKEGNKMNTSKVENAREAAIKAVRERRIASVAKTADSVDPTPAADAGALDDVETVDVTDEVSVTSETDHTPEQVSDPVDAGSKDNEGFLELPGKAKEEGHSTMNFLPGEKQSSVKRASFTQLAKLVDLYKETGVIKSNEEKYAKTAELEVLPVSVIQDRIELLTQVKASSSTRSASVARVAPPRVGTPTAPSLGRRPVARVASTSDDSSMDALLLV